MNQTVYVLACVLCGAVGLIPILLIIISEKLDLILKTIMASNGSLERLLNISNGSLQRLMDGQQIIRENQQEAIGLLEKIDQSQR